MREREKPMICGRCGREIEEIAYSWYGSKPCHVKCWEEALFAGNGDRNHRPAAVRRLSDEDKGFTPVPLCEIEKQLRSTERCENCACFVTKGNHGDGECRYNPPEIDNSGERKRGIWPMVTRHEWCSCWERKDD